MASRYREDEKHERIIRGLARLEENRKCINCGSLGPQYVCTSFSTFVCMACSGVHREFTHRVKSISMAKFSPEEVAALQAGGNKRALEMYFKNWDSRRHPIPDSSNPEKLRDFIKAVYVDQAYSANKPPPKGPPAEENDIRKFNIRPSYISSPPFEDRQQHGSPRRQFGEIHRETPHQRTRSEDRPPIYRDYDSGYSPPVRSMREILGDDLPALRIEPAAQTRHATASVDPRRTSQISRFGSFVGGGLTPSLSNAAVSKRANSESYIDFNAKSTDAAVSKRANSESYIDFNAKSTDFDFPATLATPQVQHVPADTSGWATFDSAPEQTSVPAAPTLNFQASAGEWQENWPPKQELAASRLPNMQAQFQENRSQEMTSQPQQQQVISSHPGSSRPELPEVNDLFASLPPYAGMAALTNHQFLPFGTTTMPITTFPRPSKSINPFDLPEDSSAPTVLSPNFQQGIPSSSLAPVAMPEMGEDLHHLWSQPASYPPAASSYGGYPLNLATTMAPFTSFTPDFASGEAQQGRPGNPFS